MQRELAFQLYLQMMQSYICANQGLNTLLAGVQKHIQQQNILHYAITNSAQHISHLHHHALFLQQQSLFPSQPLQSPPQHLPLSLPIDNASKFTISKSKPIRLISQQESSKRSNRIQRKDSRVKNSQQYSRQNHMNRVGKDQKCIQLQSDCLNQSDDYTNRLREHKKYSMNVISNQRKGLTERTISDIKQIKGSGRYTNDYNGNPIKIRESQKKHQLYLSMKYCDRGDHKKDNKYFSRQQTNTPDPLLSQPLQMKTTTRNNMSINVYKKGKNASMNQFTNNFNRQTTHIPFIQLAPGTVITQLPRNITKKQKKYKNVKFDEFKNFTETLKFKRTGQQNLSLGQIEQSQQEFRQTKFTYLGRSQAKKNPLFFRGSFLSGKSKQRIPKLVDRSFNFKVADYPVKDLPLQVYYVVCINQRQNYDNLQGQSDRRMENKRKKRQRITVLNKKPLLQG